MLKQIKCIVAAINPDGEPDLFFVLVKCDVDKFLGDDENNEPLEAAMRFCELEGYEPKLAYSEHDAAGKAMVPLFDWTTASVVDVEIV